MDVLIPAVDGIEAARAILAQGAVPLVFLSGYSDEDFVRRAGEAGAMAYLLKPVNGWHLGSTIEVGRRGGRSSRSNSPRRQQQDSVMPGQHTLLIIIDDGA